MTKAELDKAIELARASLTCAMFANEQIITAQALLHLNEAVGEAEAAIRGMVNSEVIKQIPFSCYSEAIDNCRDWLAKWG